MASTINSKEIYCNLTGRLGNQMFNIALGETLRKKYNIPVCYISIRKIDYSFINKEITLVNKIKIDDTFKKYFGQLSSYYKPISIDLKDNYSKYYIDGINASELYFDKDLILDLFKIKDKVKIEILNLYPDIENYVSIHLRRTDFLKYQRLYKTLTHEEVDKAISYYDNNQKFLIFSDDINWCQKEYKDYDNFIFANKDSLLVNKSILDLYSMSVCKDNIISNSTFAWWGAYLNIHKDRNVYYSEPWFNFPKQSFDIIPKNNNWISI